MSDVQGRKIEGYRFVGPHLYGPASQTCVFCGADVIELDPSSPHGGALLDRCVPWKNVDESFGAYRQRLESTGYHVSAHFLEGRMAAISAWEVAHWGTPFGPPAPVIVRGDFSTRRHIQWLRYWWELFRDLTRPATWREWLHTTAEQRSDYFRAQENQRFCPHDQSWRRFYAGRGWQTCAACGKSLYPDDRDSGRVG